MPTPNEVLVAQIVTDLVAVIDEAEKILTTAVPGAQFASFLQQVREGISRLQAAIAAHKAPPAP